VKKHPAVFNDTYLPTMAYVLRGKDKILDPFAGTGKIAKIKEHGYKGYIVCNEIEPEWANTNLYNVDEWHCGDAAHMDWAKDEEFDAISTSPTFGNRMADGYNPNSKWERIGYAEYLKRPLSNENTGSMQWGEKYKNKHIECYFEFLRVLKHGGLLVINVSNHIRGKEEVDVVGWHKDTLKCMSLKEIDDLTFATPRMRRGENNKARVKYEHLLIMAKP